MYILYNLHPLVLAACWGIGGQNHSMPRAKADLPLGAACAGAELTDQLPDPSRNAPHRCRMTAKKDGVKPLQIRA